jgi:hypothetical protein
MHTYTAKRQPINKPGLILSSKLALASGLKSQMISPKLNLQREIGGLLASDAFQSKAEEHTNDSVVTELPHFKYAFGQIPMYPKARTAAIPEIARQGTSGVACALPFLDQIQKSFGPQHDITGVKAYVGGQAAEAARQIGAEAFTTGDHVAFRASPSLHTAAHEAAHVLQQRSGIQISEGIGKKGDAYEQHADAIADDVVGGRSCESRLDAFAGDAGNQSPAIQCLDQNLPYIGSLLSYLNPRNQLARLVLPGLSDTQKSLLNGVFGASLATSIIRLNQNSLIGFGNCYRTTGNIINMPGTSIDDDHLIHEAAHVWQSQNTIFGVGYAVSALRAMAVAQVLGGDWQRAYDYRNMVRYHIPWRFWNAEQQADWIQHNRRLPNGWMLEAALPDFGIESSGIE